MNRALAALVAGLMLLLAACGSTPVPSPPPNPPAPPTAAAPARPSVPWPGGLQASDPVRCPAPTVQVTTAQELQTALDQARPGTAIGLADGTYAGQFTAATSGTADAPVWLCGGAGAVLSGPDPDDGMVLHLQKVAHWRLVGFSVRDGRKGVMADGMSASVIQGLTVSRIGDEAVHLRLGSTNNVVRGLTIHDTGLRKPKFGEGIYVGTAVSNWCSISDCQPDRSDHNVLVGNSIRDTAAENVDIKEGTTGGVLVDNTFDGTGMRGDADSWVDVKGNGWLVLDNHGTTARESGFQVNDQADGWGTGNTFYGNVADVRGPGYGYELRRPTDEAAADNRVSCTNTATGADAGLANTPCKS